MTATRTYSANPIPHHVTRLIYALLSIRHAQSLGGIQTGERALPFILWGRPLLGRRMAWMASSVTPMVSIRTRERHEGRMRHRLMRRLALPRPGRLTLLEMDGALVTAKLWTTGKANNRIQP
jgi:hypothetical protein